MKTASVNIFSVIAMVSLVGCAGMSPQGRNTAIGADVGAVGGIIGHEINK